MNLSPEQLAVVNSTAHTTVVLAGAGSGKTRVVIARIDSLIAEHAHSSSDIYAISFTRKSGHELSERLSPLAKGVWCGTLHSLCLDICQRIEGNISVLPEEVAQLLLEECGKQLGMVCQETGKWHERTLDFWRQAVDGIRQGTESKTKQAKQLTSLYESKLRAGGDCDYLGLLIRAKKHIEEGALFHIRHLFVDEAQDIDLFQWSIIELIVKKGNKCKATVVGDVRQSIYGWRGAAPDKLLNMEGERFTLCDNYRSTQTVVEASNRVIVLNPEGNVPMRYTRSQGPLEISYDPPDLRVRKALDEFYTPGEIAVLCRTNQEVREVTAMLQVCNIPIYRPEPPRAIDPVAAIMQLGIKPSSPSAWTLFRRSLRGFDIPPSQDHAAIVMEASYEPSINSIGKALLAANRPYAVVADVLPLLRDLFDVSFYERWNGYQIAKALSDRSLMDEQEPEQGNRVAVLTIHQSKGLEWPCVIVASVNQGNLPIKSALRSDKQLMEERRLCYVAMTRAQEELHILIRNTQSPSQFVLEGIIDAANDRDGIFNLTVTPF